MRHLLLAMLLSGCADPTIIVGDLEEITVLKAIPNRDLDILFVIDNSVSMAEQQASLAASFPRMMDALAQLDGGVPNLHIGVVTSDLGTRTTSGAIGPSVGTDGTGGCAGVGDDGVLRHASTRLTGTFISDIESLDGSRERNYTGELRDVFAEIAQVGAAGCGFEQHLAAMRRAFEHPANAGFIRPQANLAVVIIADEDDCSARDPSLFAPESPQLGRLDSFRCTRGGVVCDEDLSVPGVKTNCRPHAASHAVEGVQPFVATLLALKGDPRRVMVAGVVGDPEPFTVALQAHGEGEFPVLASSCTFAGPAGPEEAAPAVRLSAFLDAFPGRSQLTSICSADLSQPLATIGSTAKKLVGDPCLDAPALADVSLDPGLQPACEVVDVRDSSPDAPTVVPPCTAGATDCFQILADPRACPAAPGNLRVSFRRTTVHPDTWTHVRCQVAR